MSPATLLEPGSLCYGAGAMKPLDGVVVLDLTRYLAGPYCTLMLAGLGAEVIKVEPPEGDPYRSIPPYAGPKGAHLTRQTDGDFNLSLLNRARNKKGITLNLRSPAGMEIFRKLCQRADVVAENYLPGTLEKMGIPFPELQKLNSRLILCSISGFGQRGPYRDWRAFDPVVQGMSGISSITGYPDRPPVRCGASISDTSAALYGVIGILAALQARHRTGQGDWVDVAMLDGSFFLMGEILEFVMAGAIPRPLGNAHAGTVPFNTYKARDGWITLCVLTAREWGHFLHAIGRDDLASDPRYAADLGSRRVHREDIDALVQAWVGEHSVEDAVKTLQAHGLPAGPVRDLREVFDEEHLRAREMLMDLEHPAHGTVPGVRVPGMPIKFTHHPAAFDAPAPPLGAHNAEVFGRLGLGAADLDALRAEGVI
jgi:crotonobetainyl-CoA:carnitine CoA-transferase CaiB-like acyl-CoA transferase